MLIKSQVRAVLQLLRALISFYLIHYDGSLTVQNTKNYHLVWQEIMAGSLTTAEKTRPYNSSVFKVSNIAEEDFTLFAAKFI